MSEQALKKRASNEEYQQEDVPFSQQDFKWRKAHHRKEQAKGLDRVEVAEEELREHVRSSLEKLEERERALNNRKKIGGGRNKICREVVRLIQTFQTFSATQV